uniref:Uncharacterized protein n=1 Tax=Arundo donax TaxID=35708 RepID=A0A0A9AEN1_ARUDO
MYPWSQFSSCGASFSVLSVMSECLCLCALGVCVCVEVCLVCVGFVVVWTAFLLNI